MESAVWRERLGRNPGLPQSRATCYSRVDLSRTMPAEPQYIVVDQKTFVKEDLVLDNHVYKNCSMDKCRVYYSGGPFELIDTHITNSELVLNQPAKNIYAAIQIFRTKSPGSTVLGD